MLFVAWECTFNWHANWPGNESVNYEKHAKSGLPSYQVTYARLALRIFAFCVNLIVICLSLTCLNFSTCRTVSSVNLVGLYNLQYKWKLFIIECMFVKDYNLLIIYIFLKVY